MEEAQSNPMENFRFILEILIRLPVKSLLRFKSVSKRWHRLISDPHFVKEHLRRSLALATTTTATSHHVLSCLSHHSATSLPFYSITFDAATHSITTYPQLPHRAHPLTKILGSIDGLVLINTHCMNFSLWNPSTREFSPITSPCPLTCLEGHFMSGVGSTSSKSEYKAVIIDGGFRAFCGGYSEDENRTAVYSFKTNTWHEGNYFPYRIVYCSAGVVVNGCPHWIACLDQYESHCVIVYFDMDSEFFGLIPLPNVGDEEVVEVETLGVLKGRLCAVQRVYGSHFEIWSMTEYKMRDSWVSLLIVPEMGTTLRRLNPLCLMESGEVIMEINKNEIVVYSPESNSYQSIAPSENTSGFKVGTFVESLVSPKRLVPIEKNEVEGDAALASAVKKEEGDVLEDWEAWTTESSERWGTTVPFLQIGSCDEVREKFQKQQIPVKGKFLKRLQLHGEKRRSRSMKITNWQHILVKLRTNLKNLIGSGYMTTDENRSIQSQCTKAKG